LLTAPVAVAVDALGNLYIGETNRVRKVTNGVITTVAGNGIAGFGGDSLPATSASLNGVTGLALDSSGNLYIADSNNFRVRKVTSGGVITTVAGNGTAAASADGTTATLASLSAVAGVATDAAGNLYITELARVRKVAAGLLSTVAGNGIAGYSGDGALAVAAQINLPQGMAFDPAGNLFIADTGNFSVRKVAAAGGIISTVAGTGSDEFSGDNGPATSAELNDPIAVALDSAGNLYIAETLRVRKVTNGVVTTIAGGGNALAGTADNGPATNASIRPAGIAVDAAGAVYISDTLSNSIRKIFGGVITTFAGTGIAGSVGDNGSATLAQLNQPRGLAIDAAGALYIADGANNRVRKVSAGIITTIAGTGAAGYNGDGGAATSALLNGPFSVAVDSSGAVYVMEYSGQRVRKIAAGVISTIAGTGVAGFSGDGLLATGAQIASGQGVGVDAAGNVYITDSGNFRVRKIASGTITTIAGTGTPGFSGDGGAATSAQLGPQGIAVTSTGNVYVADTSNRIRYLTASAGPTCTYTVAPITLQASAAGGNLSIAIQTTSGCAWTITGLPTWLAVGGLLSGTGPANVTLVVSANSGAARTATITVAGTAVTVTQASNSSCSYSLSLSGQSYPATGGNGTVGISAAAGCTWTATSSVTWITVTGNSTGSGNATITYTVAANTGAARTGILTIGGLTFTVQQVSSSGTGFTSTGAMAQVAADGSWKTSFTLVNTGTTAASARLSFYDNNGNPLTLTLSFPATPNAGTVIGPAIEQVINPGAELLINTSGPDAQPLVIGWAQMLTNGSVTGFAVFQQTIGTTVQEAVVPLETRTPVSFLLSFDNANNYSTGVAIANVSASFATIPVTIRDDAGNVLLSATTTLPALGHSSFDLASTYAVTAGRRGTIEFGTPAGGQLTVLGLRFTQTGAFSTLPVATK
jgi:trimeric autotransporter adhesin